MYANLSENEIAKEMFIQENEAQVEDEPSALVLIARAQEGLKHNIYKPGKGDYNLVRHEFDESSFYIFYKTKDVEGPKDASMIKNEQIRYEDLASLKTSREIESFLTEVAKKGFEKAKKKFHIQS